MLSNAVSLGSDVSSLVPGTIMGQYHLVWLKTVDTRRNELISTNLEEVRFVSDRLKRYAITV
jgi:murein L,D-transpeptidase YcbB/YkuD